ncbi:conserved hypothetical protein [Ricinus communis]|uniref:Uncharacterized protein n=1 Tax=Ricinus communis TaxID=3988 RepID=B9SPA0_RICCO|nr:conserved hypothetical protein [Ricinus communis]
MAPQDVQSRETLIPPTKNVIVEEESEILPLVQNSYANPMIDVFKMQVEATRKYMEEAHNKLIENQKKVANDLMQQFSNVMANIAEKSLSTFLNRVLGQEARISCHRL